MATYSLIINGAIVAASPGLPFGQLPGFVSLVRMERNYDDPAELVIRSEGDWRNAPYAADTPVTLTRDGAVVFEGLLYIPRPALSVNEYPAVEYTAYDRSHALRGPTAETEEGYPEIALAGGTLGTVAAAYFALAADLLTARGVSATPVFLGNSDAVSCFPVSLSGESIDEAVRQIAAAAPGVRVFMAPPTSVGGLSAYTFVRLMRSPLVDLTIDARRVLSLDIQPSVEGRCGAVKTLGGQTTGTGEVEILEDEPLDPAWNPALEASWSLHDAYERADDGTLANPDLALVYRKFTWTSDGITAERIRRAEIQIIENVDALQRRWQPRIVESVDVENKTVILKRPAIVPYLTRNRLQFRSPNHRGRAKQATAKLRIGTGATGSTPIYITSYRVPETGFSGRAYQLAPITCGYEKKVAVPAGVDHEQYALDAHTALSEPVVTGSVPLDEGLPADFWRLNRRLNIRTDSQGATGYEDLAAPVLGITQTWEAGESSTLQFNRDDTVGLAEGAQ